MKTSRRLAYIIVTACAAAVIISGWFVWSERRSAPSTTSDKLHIVAGENFWGSLVSQIGGSHVDVTTIVADPDADPHEFESSTMTARQFATADYVVLNGAGYDSWGDHLLSATDNTHRKVLIIADLIGKKEGDNPHFWYNPNYVNAAALQMKNDLESIDTADKAYFEAQYATLHSNLTGYQATIDAIKEQYPGTKVAATEDIFQYLADAAGLDLVSPQAFITAVAEGNDPPTQSIVAFQQQLESGEVKVLVYNTQTVTPLTENMKKLAEQHHIPIVGISETIQPPAAPFQLWMGKEVQALRDALND